MDFSFPVFILASDDRSIRISETKSDLLYYEQPDVNEGIYTGWDKQGYPLRLIWDPVEGPKLQGEGTEPQERSLQEALYEYARAYRPGVRFAYLGPQDDPVQLFKAIQAHIDKGKNS